jgi:hypothetical protein
MTKVLNDTNTSELLKLSAGNLEVLVKLAEEFRNRVEEISKKTETKEKVKEQTKVAVAL